MVRRIILTEEQIRKVTLSEMTSSEIDLEARNTDTNPTEAQTKAGNYKKAHVRVKGLPIAIETPKGCVRSGKDKNGKEWSIVMKNHYGYFNLTDGDGKDGDAIDVFLGPDIDNFDNVYVVDQKNTKGEFDESKVMLGFTSKEQAKNAYMSNYSDDWKGFVAITGVSFKFFKKWLYDKQRQRKPFKDYVDVRKKKIVEGVNKYKTLEELNRIPALSGLSLINETSLNRIMSHGKDGFIIISGNKGEVHYDNPEIDLTQDYKDWLSKTPNLTGQENEYNLRDEF